jgi:hypothetical protein
MRYFVGFACAVVPLLVFLVDPTPRQSAETVDSVTACVQKHWRGLPVEQWADASDMDATCRSILQRAREANR